MKPRKRPVAWKRLHAEIREAKRVVRGLRKLGFGPAIDADMALIRSVGPKATEGDRG
jgi:hypothetical protein